MDHGSNRGLSQCAPAQGPARVAAAVATEEKIESAQEMRIDSRQMEAHLGF
jgi:hypothetical protein